jgi:hypothetical protein
MLVTRTSGEPESALLHAFSLAMDSTQECSHAMNLHAPHKPNSGSELSVPSHFHMLTPPIFFICRWALFPWVLDTKGAGKYDGCGNPDGAAKTFATYLAKESSPAFEGDVVASAANVDTYVCQNMVPVA